MCRTASTCGPARSTTGCSPSAMRAQPRYRRLPRWRRPNNQSVCSGLPLRGPLANASSCFSLMLSTISRDAPLSLDLGVSPRLALSAAPAAFCWALDLAGMASLLSVPAQPQRSSGPRDATPDRDHAISPTFPFAPPSVQGQDISPIIGLRGIFARGRHRQVDHVTDLDTRPDYIGLDCHGHKFGREWCRDTVVS